MPKYIPLQIPTKVRTSYSDVLSFHWAKDRRITADFLIPDDEEHVLRLRFARVEIARLLDEMPVSTEKDSAPTGLVPDHLAYEVTGSAFSAQQSEALKVAVPGLKHYRFITGWTCIDVLSTTAPEFSVVPKPARRAD